MTDGAPNRKTPQEAPYIIMVDDDLEDAFVMRRALREIDDTVIFEHIIDSEVFVRSLADGSTEYAAAQILLVDLNMLGVDGFEVIEASRSNPAFDDTLIIMLTSSYRDEDRDKAISSGADRFITKPNTIDEMLSMAVDLIS